jgi:hypothetical protein
MGRIWRHSPAHTPNQAACYTLRLHRLDHGGYKVEALPSCNSWLGERLRRWLAAYCFLSLFLKVLDRSVDPMNNSS